MTVFGALSQVPELRLEITRVSRERVKAARCSKLNRSRIKDLEFEAKCQRSAANYLVRTDIGRKLT
jgi:hypothetical protein